MSDWQSFVQAFYQLPLEERRRHWDGLANDQRYAFELAAKNMRLGPLVHDLSATTASFPVRAAAFLVDLGVTGTFGFLAFPLADVHAALTYLAFSASIAYFFCKDALPHGQSLGKKLFRLAVVDWKTGDPCSLRQSISRNLVHFAGIFDYAGALRSSGRRIGDDLAGTAVVARNRSV